MESEQTHPNHSKQPSPRGSQEQPPDEPTAAPVLTESPDDKKPIKVYNLEVLVGVEENQPHLVDVVAVHDYDETSVNWAYRDKDAILQQQIDDVRAKKLKLSETSGKMPDVSDERGRRTSPMEPGRLASSGTASLVPPQPAITRAPSLQDAGKKMESSPRSGMPPQNFLAPEAHDVGSSKNTDAGSSRGSSPGRATGPNWLQDTDMLPRSLQGVRVLGFSYLAQHLKKLLRDDAEENKRSDFIDRAASGLLRELEKARSSASCSDVPIVFIGAGFGGIVLQRAITLAVSKPRQAAGAAGKSTESEAQTGNPRDEQVPESLPLHLNQIADIMFLDTPFPRKEGIGLTGFFPPDAASLRATRIVRISNRMESEWDVPGIDKVWNQFWSALCRQGETTRISWFYSSMTNSASVPGRSPLAVKKISQSDYGKGLPVIAVYQTHLQRTDFCRLTNIRDAKDASYVAIVSRMQWCLMMKAVTNKRFRALQLGLMRTGVSVNAEDEGGSSLLHLATESRNPEGVKMLLENDANHRARNLARQTPLLLATELYRNTYSSSAIEDLCHVLDVIEKLLSYTTKPELNNIRDRQNRTVRDILQSLARRHDAIQELLDKHRPFVRKRVTNDREEAWKTWSAPVEGTLRHKACNGARGLIAEFYDSGIDGASSDYEVPSVLDLIYRKDSGPVRMVSRWAETKINRQGVVDIHCRWIHIPANNEQWIHDLFVRLGLLDSSTDGQRHKGYTVFNQYMTPDAKRYRQRRFPPSIAVQTPRLDAISEDPGDALENHHSNSRGFLEVMKADGRGWAGLPVPKGLEATSDIIALFMPVLAFEEHKSRKKMTRAIHRALAREASSSSTTEWAPRRSSTMNSSEMSGVFKVDTSVVESYLLSDRPIHCRRTLDQYRYYMLETTESRDRDQVVYKWARNREHRKRESGSVDVLGEKVFKASNRPVIMVDQLWLWILPDGTVISSLPNTADANEPYNLGYKLESSMFDGTEPPVRSVDDLFSAILKNCVDFFRREGPCDVRFHDCFQYSINDIAEAEAKTYAEYRKAVTCLERLKSRGLLRTLSQRYTDTFSQITEETNRLVEIMDIQDELSIVESVLLVQKNVLNKFIQRVHTKAKIQRGESMMQAKEIALKDSSRIKDIIQIVEDNLDSVKEMVTSAKKVQEDLKQLLDFKQQQSNAWEMQYSMKLALQGRKQNNIMLVFTLVTIVFLPMSFMSSFFAIGVDGFPRDAETGETSWPLGQLCAYLFGISLAVSIPMIVAAFYINDISRMAKRSPKANEFNEHGATRDSPADHDSDADSDMDMDPKSGIAAAGRQHRGSAHFPAEDKEYAPLFGVFNFHTSIPFVRRLWKYWPYREGLGEELEDLEDLDWDYPLSRYRKKVMGPVNHVLLHIGLRRLGTAYLDHERRYMLEHTPDGLYKQLLREKIDLEKAKNARVTEKAASPHAMVSSSQAVRGQGGSLDQGSRNRMSFGIRDALGRRRSQGLEEV